MADLDQATVPAIVSRDLSETEKSKRSLQKRYKALYGFKPVGLSHADLTALVRRAEHARGIVPEEEIPATPDTVAEFAAKFGK
jgi:hypothetical protein